MFSAIFIYFQLFYFLTRFHPWYKALNDIIHFQFQSILFFQDWKKRTDLKILLYEVITNYYMGRNSEEQEKFGECVAYFTLSFDKLKDCIKMAKVWFIYYKLIQVYMLI